MGSIKWDDTALKRVVGAAARAEVKSAVERTKASANAMSADYRTGFYHRQHKSPSVGGTQPSYGGDVQDFDGWPVGIVYTGNYAAMKDNAENNTLLKARG